MLTSSSIQSDAEEARQDMIDQITEAIKEIKFSPVITVNVPKQELTVDLKAQKPDAPTINVSVPKFDFPKNSHPFAHGAVCTVTKRNLHGFTEQFTITPIKP